MARCKNCGRRMKKVRRSADGHKRCSGGYNCKRTRYVPPAAVSARADAIYAEMQARQDRGEPDDLAACIAAVDRRQ